jgi:hypothetical protein
MKKYFAFVLVLVLFAAIPAYAADDFDILKAVARAGKAKIPPKGCHCEINGTKALGINNEIAAGDVLAHYINFSLSESSSKMHSFTCTGEKILNCVLEYGEKADNKNPGWQIFFKFRYNADTDKIGIDTLECIQVP